jgi:hypothetical protein
MVAPRDSCIRILVFATKKEAQEQTQFQLGGVYNIDERVARATGTARKNPAGDSGII